jgi:hypothetical protein
MSKVKVTAMALVAVFAFSAVAAAATASAAWFVGGAELKTSAALTTAAAVDEDFKLLVPAVEDLTIECTGTTLDGIGPRIEGTDKSFASSLKILGCKTIKPLGCPIEAQPVTITTNAILVLAALKSGEADKLTYFGEAGDTITVIRFGEANTCAFNSEEGVKGSVTLGAPTGELELENQAVVGLGSFENNSLEVANSKAYVIGGKALLRLASGSKWSFH